MAKYDDLKRYLNSQKNNIINLTFKQVEQIIARKLPATAYSSKWWWINVTNEPAKVQGDTVSSTSYEVTLVNFASKEVTFQRLDYLLEKLD